MVGLFKKILLPLLFATFAAAANLEVTEPSTDIWWVAQSTNVMAWNCQSQVNQPNPINNFTVLINNVNPSVLAGPLAFIAIQELDQCSITVSPNQVNQPASSGYILLLADDFNNTNVYATSQQFEIRPLGSAYPSQVSSSSSVASGTATSSPSASPSSGSALGVHSPSFLGLAGLMGLMAAGMLGT